MNSDLMSFERRVSEICVELGYTPFFECGEGDKVLVTHMPASVILPFSVHHIDSQRAKAKAVMRLAKRANGCCEALKFELRESIKRDCQSLLSWFGNMPRVVEVVDMQIVPKPVALTKSEEVGVELQFSFVFISLY